MAISWEVKVTKVYISTGRADVSVTRIDSELLDGTRTFVMTNTPFETPEQRAWVITGLKGWVEQEEAAKVAMRTFVGDFEQVAQAELTQWETTR